MTDIREDGALVDVELPHRNPETMALAYIRYLARMEQDNPTGLHMTCLSIIEKTALEALPEDLR